MTRAGAMTLNFKVLQLADSRDFNLERIWNTQAD